MLTNADTVSFSVFPERQSDGIYRSGQLVVFNTQENSLKFSLEILILCQLHGIPPETIKLKDSIWKGKFLAMKLESGKDIRIPIDAAGRTFPRLIRNFKRFPSMSFIDVLLSSEKTKGESFQHKISLIGVTTPDVPKAQAIKLSFFILLYLPLYQALDQFWCFIIDVTTVHNSYSPPGCLFCTYYFLSPYLS